MNLNFRWTKRLISVEEILIVLWNSIGSKTLWGIDLGIPLAKNYSNCGYEFYLEHS